MDPLVAHIRSVVLSCPKDILMTITRLVNDYRALTGTPLPYAQRGFSSPREMLLSFSEHFNFTQLNGETIVSVPLSTCQSGEALIRRMVEKSKPKKPRHSRGKVTTRGATNHYRTRLQPLIRPHLDANTQMQMKNLATISQRKEVLLTETTFWEHFQRTYGYRLDHLRNGFKTQSELLDFAVYNHVLRKVHFPSGTHRFFPYSEENSAQSRTVNSELREILDFLKSLLACMTGVPILDLPELYRTKRGGDFLALTQAAGHHRIYPLIQQISDSGHIAVSHPSMETSLVGPVSSIADQSAPQRDYPTGRPRCVQVVSAESVDNIELVFLDINDSDSTACAQSLKRVYTGQNIPLVSKVTSGLHCVYRHNEDCCRVQITSVKLCPSGKLCAFLRRLDSVGDTIRVPLPTSTLLKLVPEVAHWPQIYFTAGLAWIRQLGDNSNSWKENLINKSFLSFNAPDCDDDLVRVSLRSPDFSCNVGWTLVEEGFAEWIRPS